MPENPGVSPGLVLVPVQLRVLITFLESRITSFPMNTVAAKSSIPFIKGSWSPIILSKRTLEF